MLLLVFKSYLPYKYSFRPVFIYIYFSDFKCTPLSLPYQRLSIFVHSKPDKLYFYFSSSKSTKSSTKHNTQPGDDSQKVLNNLDIYVNDTIKHSDKDYKYSSKNESEDFSSKTLPQYHGSLKYKTHSVQIEANIIGQYQVMNNNNNYIRIKDFEKEKNDFHSDREVDEGIGSAESLVSQQNEHGNIY